MVRENVSTSLCLKEMPFITDGSAVKGLLSIDVRKHDVVIGQLTATLTCEERIGTTQSSSVLVRHQLDGIPSRLPRGLHEYEFSFPIATQSLADFPPSLPTDTKHDSVGVYWILEIYGDPRTALSCSTIVPVYPSRVINLSENDAVATGYKKVYQRVPMITSFVAGPPCKKRPKLLLMLFGPSYRSPKDGELCEVFVRLGISVPKTGVFQSPSKSHLGVHASTAADDAVVLSMCFVKLVSKTIVKGTTKTYTSTADILERELELVLPRGNFNLSDEVADLELPPCPGTTESNMLEQQYEIKFTFVLRALHFPNFTRWVTLVAPITVLPASLSLDDNLVEAPPPYAG